jgi:hypothetical protein
MFMNLKELSRPLEISDVDFRVQSINNAGYATILAYKDARVDMNRLDEVMGPLGWQRDYTLIDGKLFCGVGIYDKENNQWVWKWDVGTESNTESEKGQASDAFKRACFNLGIGRELYDYPIISVKLNANEWTKDGGRPKQTYELKIKDWRWYSEFTDGRISFLAAKDQNGTVRFKWGAMKPKQEEPSYTPASGGEPVSSEPVEVKPAPVEEGNVSGLLKKNDDPVDVDIQFQVGEDNEREEAVRDYEAMFGKKPHGRASVEKIRQEIMEETQRRMAEKLDEEEEPTMPQPEEEEEEVTVNNTILNHLSEIEKYTDATQFVAWAKGIVAQYLEVDDADVIDTFKDYCNNHYSKIAGK